MVPSVPFTPSPSQTFLPRASIILQEVSTQIKRLPPGEGKLFHISGQPGAGKTEFAFQLTEELQGWTIVRVTALSWLKDSPKNLLSHIAHKLGAHSANSIRGVIDRVDAATVIIVDDIHWADQESMQKLIEFSMRMVSGRFALIMIGLDEEEFAFPDHSIALPTIADATYVLPPMSIEEIRQLALTQVRGRISAMTATDIQRITGGVYSRVKEVLSAEAPEHWKMPDPNIPIPPSWWANLRRRINGQDFGSVLLAVAVLPHGGPIDLVKHLGNDPEGLLCDAAVRAGLLRVLPSDGAPQLDLVLPMDRAVLQSRTPMSTLAELHHKAAQYWDKWNRVDQSLQHRAFAAQSPEDHAIKALAQRGYDLGKSGHWMESAHALSLAANRTTHIEDATKYHLESIDSLIAAADLAQARAKAATLDLGEHGVQQDSMLGYLAIHEGRRSEARNLLDRAADSLLEQHPIDPMLGPRVAQRKVLLNLVDWRPDELLQWAGHAVEWTDEDAGEKIEAQAISLIGQSIIDGKLPEDKPIPGETTLHAQRRHMAMGWLSMVHDDPVTARQKLERRTSINGSERISLWQDGWLARSLLLLGEWDSAARTVEIGLARAEQFGIRFLEPLLLWTGAQLASARGNEDLARNYMRRLSTDQDSFIVQSMPSAMCRMWVYSQRNEIAGAIVAGQTLEKLGSQPYVNAPGFWPWQDIHATHLIRNGEIERAEQLVAETIEDLQHSDIMSARAKIAVPEAMLMIHHGDVKQGFARFDDALDMLDPLTLPYYRARICFEYGQALRRQGQRRRADEQFARASAVFQDMGAYAMVTRANRERRVGGLGQRSEMAGGLTPQEYEIAQLVATGHSNREVANELFLSPKTVEYHLTRVYKKLGIRNRIELSDALAKYSHSS
ncbi:LuxR family transcriptional regulator [Corynebacterium deserti GIMN1.010]|uniref:LuxR family transcriptional regulator n=1 Tax=Corynebacterium deserti GIMN1.010 TaxID=931089 RepID=A0A0M4CHC9_9CORY|nr:LuxR C-terminal-related transcriptional regulator [Corynebacterium deserti]ALC06565.1 LuxR family transcriptional regulator [Corynebacterium deserti GIMN1.010]